MQTIYDFFRNCFTSTSADVAMEVNLSQDPKWRNLGDGHYEWTGDTFDNNDFYNTVNTILDAQSLSFPKVTGTLSILDNSTFKLNTVNAPLATAAYLRCETLKNITMPNVEEFDMARNKAAISIDLPKAKIVTLRVNEALCNVSLPNAEEVFLHYNNALNVDRIISTIKNPQTLNRFIVNDNDITQDIKNADRELNVSEYVKQQNNEAQFDTFIGKVGEAGKTLENTIFDMGRLGSQSYDEKASLFNSTMNFYGLKHEDLDQGIHYQTNQGNADERIKDYKQQRIAERTHAHTAARETIDDIMNDNRIGRY